MTRSTTLDPAAPMRSLREAVGLTQAAMAERRGVYQSSISEAERSAAAVSVGKLREAAEACGLELEIRVRPREG